MVVRIPADHDDPERTLVSAPVALPASALIIEVPEAGPVVDPWRASLDELAPVGVPAHVTCLFPIPPEDAMTGPAKIADAVRDSGAFDYTFDRCAWFGRTVLWLAPQDPTPFLRLTHALTTAFPHLLPYEGRFPEVIPHLTIGHKCPAEALDDAERDITPQLPIHGRATHLSLYSPQQGVWTRLQSFPL